MQIKMNNADHYKTLVAAYKKGYQASGTNASNLTTAQKLWNQVKTSKEDYDKALLDLKAKAAKNEEKTCKWWSNVKAVTKTMSPVASESAAGSSSKLLGNVSLSTSDMSLGTSNALSTVDPSTPTIEASETHETASPVLRPTPTQAHLRNEISELNSKIVLLSHLKSSGFATAENIKQLNMARLELKQSEAKLRYLISDAEKQKKRSAEKKALVMQFAGQNESNAAEVRKFTHSSPGHPPLKDMYPDLHQAIVELATAGAGADRRRRTDV